MITLITERELAERLNCPRDAVRSMRERGEIPFLKLRPVVFDEVDVLRIFGRYPILTAKEAAERLGVAPIRLVRLCEAGRIPCLKLGRVCFRVEDLDEFLARWGSLDACEADLEAGYARLMAEQAAQKAWWREQQRALTQEVRQAKEAARVAAHECVTRQKPRKAVLPCPRPPAALDTATCCRKVLRKMPWGVWYVFWTEGRRSKRLSTGTKDAKAAERFLRKLLDPGV